MMCFSASFMLAYRWAMQIKLNVDIPKAEHRMCHVKCGYKVILAIRPILVIKTTYTNATTVSPFFLYIYPSTCCLLICTMFVTSKCKYFPFRVGNYELYICFLKKQKIFTRLVSLPEHTRFKIHVIQKVLFLFRSRLTL